MNLTDYIALFPGATREKPRFMALAEAVLRQAADLQALVPLLPEAYSLEHAVGIQLDALAGSVGLSRADSPQGAGATDGEFRAFVADKLRLWRWDGTNGGQQR